VHEFVKISFKGAP